MGDSGHAAGQRAGDAGPNQFILGFVPRIADRGAADFPFLWLRLIGGIQAAQYLEMAVRVCAGEIAVAQLQR